MLTKEILQLCYLCLITVCVNFITCADDNSMWHSYQFGTGIGNREELVITDVQSNENFTLREDVSRWKSICTGKKCYAAGLLENGFILLVAELGPDQKKFITSSDVVELDESFTDIELFENWNKTSKQSEVILVGTSGGLNYQILWYKIVENSLQHILTWDIYGPAMYLRYFRMENNTHHLLVLAEGHKGRNVDLYTFSDLGGVHSLDPLISTSTSTNELALNWYGSDMYISIPQPVADKILIYKLTSEYGFEAYEDLVLKGITHINSFKIGFQSFLTVGGKNAGIYKFTKTNLVRQNIKGLNLDSINFWFPVPVKTYRDEVVLILQRSINHESHKSFSPEVVLHNGNEFSLHDEISCTFFGENENGLGCILDEDRDKEGFGAAVLSLGNTVGILVPRRNNSGLFMIHTEMKKLKSPVQLEIEKLKETREKLQQMINDQKSQIKDIRGRLQHSVKLNESNVISAPWKLDSLSVPAFPEGSHTIIKRQTPKKVNIQKLEADVVKIRKAVEDGRKQLENTIPLDKSPNRFHRLMVDGQVDPRLESKFKIVMLEKFNDEPVHEVLNDLVRKKSINPISGHKTFTNMEVENITFDVVNEMGAAKIIKNTGTPIVVNNSVLFDQLVKVTGNVIVNSETVNDIDLFKEIVEMNKEHKEPLKFEHIKTDSALSDTLQVEPITGDSGLLVNADEIDLDIVRLHGNVTVEDVNGENFAEFLKTLCFTNTKCYIPGDITLAGDLNVEGNAAITLLNDLKFPEQYIVGGLEYSEFTGEKIFEGEVFAHEVSAIGTLNGMNAEDILTMTNNQSSLGSFTFNDLEVTEDLTVAGAIIGPSVTNFLPNPDLSETKKIRAKVNFKLLEVEGNVVVSEKYNQNNFGDILSEVLYKDEKEATINSVKDFLGGFTVINGIKLESNAINSISIAEFITKNTEQTIVFKSLNGAVSFENLALRGLYGDVNITQLEEQTVKLTGEQFVTSTLIFDNNDEILPDLSSTDFRITKTLNELTVKDYLFTTGDSRSWTKADEFDKLQAENVFIEGDLTGYFTNFSMQNFDDRRISLTQDQIITASYNIKNLEIEDFQAEIINEDAFEKFFNYEYYVNKISEMLVMGKLTITNLNVNGSVFAENVNGKSMDDLIKTSIWMTRNNYFQTAAFYGDVFFYHLQLKNFNSVDFELFCNNIIYKTETNPLIRSTKIFENGFYVTRMLNSERLNDIYVDDILTYTGDQQLVGPLNIQGDVRINLDCEIDGNLNDLSIEYLSNTYQFVNDDTCIINDDIIMDRLSKIRNLQVEGCANNEYLEEFLSQMVMKAYDNELPKITFDSTVHINQNMIIMETLNDIDLSDHVEDMVFTTKDEFIEQCVTFTQLVEVAEELNIESNLGTQYIIGIDLNNWKNDAVFVNKGIISGKIKFESVTIEDQLNVNYINNLDLHSLIPLRTKQIIDKCLIFSELISFQNISVGNHVNGYNMIEEYQNSLLEFGEIQRIETRITFSETTSVGNARIVNLVNGNDIRAVVTTYTEQRLNAIYNFTEQIIFESPLIIKGLVNNIDVVDWHEKSAKTEIEYVQTLSGNWTVGGNITFGKNVGGSGLIAQMDIEKLVDATEKNRMVMFYTTTGLLENYTNICQEVSYLLDKTQDQLYMFKYLESLQILEIENGIRAVLHFKRGTDNYVLLNENNSCSSHLFIWTKSQFQAVITIDTGVVTQFLSVYDGDQVFVVSRNNEPSNCPLDGTNVWRLHFNNIIHEFKLQDFELLQESLVPGTFYGLVNNVVLELRLITNGELSIKAVRRWTLHSENNTFVPRGLGTGLALSNGYKLFRLIREEPVIEVANTVYESIILGAVVEEMNIFLPRYNRGEALVINVGVGDRKRSLVAVASHEETSVKGRLDFIKIYENIFTGKLFHKVPSYKPSSLVSLEFDNGESLLAFLEDEKTLQVYEYKGIEGFRQRISAKLEATRLIVISLPIKGNRKHASVLGVINGNKINFIQTVMTGDQIVMEQPTCEL